MLDRRGFMAACSCFGVTCAAASSSMAQPLMVLGFDPDRSLSCGAGSFSFVDGNVHAAARAEVLNSANFGPSGVITRTVVLTSAPVLEDAALVGVDVVIINPLRTPLTACERRLLRDFIEQGGGVFAFANEAARDFPTVVECGPPVSCGGGGPFNFVNLGHPAVDGPFGANIGSLASTFHCRFESLGPHGTAILSSTAPMGAAFEVGLGRAVIVNDEEWLMNVGGCPASLAWGARSRVLLLNAIAWVMPDPAFLFSPVVRECYPDCDSNCILDIFDFLCFGNLFDAGDPYACDCDTSTGPGVCDIFDFLCFGNAFTSGC